MTSPFKTYAEFSGAEGGIYAFANNPSIIMALLGISVLLFLYFLLFTCAPKMMNGANRVPPTAIGLLIGVGLVPILTALYATPADAIAGPNATMESQSWNGMPWLLTLTAGGVAWHGWRKGQRRRRSRR
ncbi:MAG: hypothetical protein IGQ88_11185 [Gloeomargaritaceae cyanobacterium C42_A2020_066]|nr:hypothetical protein [Gloeomargaritaceae cyanobacterium C42_A2020_066]